MTWITTAIIAWLTFIAGSVVSAILLKRKAKAYIKANGELYQAVITKLTTQLNELEQVIATSTPITADNANVLESTKETL